MNRRQFLHWTWRGAAGAAAVVAGWQAAARFAALRRLTGSAHAPGAVLEVLIDGAAPAGWQLGWQIAHEGQRHLLPLRELSRVARTEGAVVTATHITCEVPYPYDDLVPGCYQVALSLTDASGVPVCVEQVGQFTLRRQRFSA